MFKIIKKSIRQYKFIAIITPICVFCEVILEMLLPYIMAYIIDDITNMENLITYGSLLFVVALAALFFGVFSGMSAAKAAAGLASNLRHDVYTKIQSFSFKDTDKFSTSSLVTRLTTDITNIQNSFTMIIRIAVRIPTLFITATVMAFIVSHEMALYFVAVIPVLLIGLVLILKNAYPLFDKIFPKYDKMNKYIQENIKGIRVVKTFATEEKEKTKFDEKADDIKRSFTKAEKITALNNPLMIFSMFFLQILLYSFGSYLIVSTFGGYVDGKEVWGSLSIGQLQSLLTYSTTVLSSLLMLMMIFVMLSISRTNSRRVLEVLNYEPTMTSENNVSTVLNGDILFKDVYFKYNEHSEKSTLEKINLKIESGGQIGILGGTGSGKSSLINLIPRLYDVNEGILEVGGVNVADYDLKALRDGVAVVLQKNVLFSGTIRDNLKWGNEDATDEEIYEACNNACATEFINKFPDKLDTLIDQGGTNVSGGQKQRLCIARALLKKPKILILDDSTSAVDTKTDMMINKAFKENLKETTKLIISQRLSSLETCDLIIVMDDGKINQIDTHENLLETNEIYKEVYAVQMKNKSAEGVDLSE